MADHPVESGEDLPVGQIHRITTSAPEGLGLTIPVWALWAPAFANTSVIGEGTWLRHIDHLDIATGASNSGYEHATTRRQPP